MAERVKASDLMDTIMQANDYIEAGDDSSALYIIQQTAKRLFTNELSTAFNNDCDVDIKSLLFDVYSAKELSVKFGMSYYRLSQALDGHCEKVQINATIDGVKLVKKFYIFKRAALWKSLKPSNFIKRWEAGMRYSGDKRLTDEQMKLVKPSPYHTAEEII